MIGVCISFSRFKGFGFIRADGGTDDLFVHRRELENARYLNAGETVSFRVGEHNGRKVAKKGLRRKRQQKMIQTKENTMSDLDRLSWNVEEKMYLASKIVERLAAETGEPATRELANAVNNWLAFRETRTGTAPVEE